MATIVVGVVTVTLATGATSTMVAFGNYGRTDGTVVNVQVGTPANGLAGPKLTDAEIEALLRSLPGADRVTARMLLPMHLDGFTQTRFANFYRRDTPPVFLSGTVEGRWPERPGEVVAGPSFLAQHGLAVGDRITMRLAGRQVSATIVGERGDANRRSVSSTWPTLAEVAPNTDLSSTTSSSLPAPTPRRTSTRSGRPTRASTRHR